MQNTAYSGTDKIPFSKPKFRWEIRIEYAGLWHKLENNAKKIRFFTPFSGLFPQKTTLFSTWAHWNAHFRRRGFGNTAAIAACHSRSFSQNWFSNLRELDLHFPIAVSLAAFAAKIAFFLKRNCARLDRALRFADCCGKIFLCNRRIRRNHAKHSQLFQRAVQSAIIALWRFRRYTLDRSIGFVLLMEIAVFNSCCAPSRRFSKNFSKYSLVAWMPFCRLL